MQHRVLLRQVGFTMLEMAFDSAFRQWCYHKFFGVFQSLNMLEQSLVDNDQAVRRKRSAA